MVINSQLSAIESKKQTNRTETETQMCRSFAGLSFGRGQGENGGKGARIKKYKLVDTEQTGMLRTVEEMEQPKNSHA